MRKSLVTLLILAILGLGALSASATEHLRRGPVTNLPLPRFVSMKAEKANVRRGPSMTHRVDWVFTLENMPLKIIAEYGNWRRVLDVDGAGGWIHYSLLSGVRTVLIRKNYTPLRSYSDVGADPNAYAEKGVVAFLKSCQQDWCQIRADGLKGWVLKTEIWGVVQPPESGEANTDTKAADKEKSD